MLIEADWLMDLIKDTEKAERRKKRILL